MYIADLTEVLVRRKLLQLPSSDWVLCLADLTLALPLDRTVASLEDKTDLILVRRQWAAEHGLRPGGVRGGDPSQSIFKRTSEPMPHARLGALELGQTYKVRIQAGRMQLTVRNGRCSAKRRSGGTSAYSLSTATTFTSSRRKTAPSSIP